MANISFETDVVNRNQRRNSKAGLSGKLISWGLAKNEKQANVYIVIFIVLALGITLFNLTNLGDSRTDVPQEGTL